MFSYTNPTTVVVIKAQPGLALPTHGKYLLETALPRFWPSTGLQMAMGHLSRSQRHLISVPVSFNSSTQWAPTASTGISVILMELALAWLALHSQTTTSRSAQLEMVKARAPALRSDALPVPCARMHTKTQMITTPDSAQQTLVICGWIFARPLTYSTTRSGERLADAMDMAIGMRKASLKTRSRAFLRFFDSLIPSIAFLFIMYTYLEDGFVVDGRHRVSLPTGENSRYWAWGLLYCL